MLKVLFTTNIPSPYRVEFFNCLAKHVDLTVWYFWEKGMTNRPWGFEDAQHNYNYSVLKELKIGKFRFNPGVSRLIGESKFDIIIVGGYSLLSEMILIRYLKKHHIDFVLNSDGGFINNRNIILEKAKKKLIGSASYWLASGNKCSETLIYYGAKPEKIFLYHFSSIKDQDISDSKISDTEKIAIRRELSLPYDKSIIITVGQYIHRKGIDIFLDCAKAFNNSNSLFITIGQGPLLEEYNEFVKQHGLTNVWILDYMNKTDLIKYYKAADLFILPTREDIWGLVLNEAIACGLPIIASDKAGAAYDLIDGNGFMVSLETEELINKIDCILKNKCLSEDFSNQSLLIAKGYTIERMVEDHMELFNAIIE